MKQNASSDRSPASEPDWALLVEQMAHGIAGAYLDFVEAFGPRLGSWARKKLPLGTPFEDVEEVVLETLLDAWQQASLYDPARASVPTWLGWLLRKHLSQKYRELRRLQRIHQAVQHALSEKDKAPNSEMVVLERSIAEETADAINQAMQDIAESDADLIRRRYFVRQSVATIAVELGISEVATRQRLSRATRRLREQLYTLGVRAKVPGEGRIK